MATVRWSLFAHGGLRLSLSISLFLSGRKWVQQRTNQTLIVLTVSTQPVEEEEEERCPIFTHLHERRKWTKQKLKETNGLRVSRCAVIAGLIHIQARPCKRRKLLYCINGRPFSFSSFPKLRIPTKTKDLVHSLP